MDFKNKPSFEKIQFYTTTEYNCSYIDKMDAQSLVVTPYKSINQNTFQDLIEKGFRRSGQYIYKPNCKSCTACIPIRLSVKKFLPSKTQKRTYKKHGYFTIREAPLSFKKNHFDLYLKYQNNRHSFINNEQNNLDEYNDFLIKSNVKSKFIEFWDGDLLKIVSIVDILSDGISAVYTFYDPDDDKVSYGTYSIVWLINWCKAQQLKYIYLGYWIGECNKMKYKTNFKPYELYIKGYWQENIT
jgi:arginine-tRNA-protein transferase